MNKNTQENLGDTMNISEQLKACLSPRAQRPTPPSEMLTELHSVNGLMMEISHCSCGSQSFLIFHFRGDARDHYFCNKCNEIYMPPMREGS